VRAFASPLISSKTSLPRQTFPCQQGSQLFEVQLAWYS
jgi:hypothetical protein